MELQKRPKQERGGGAAIANAMAALHPKGPRVGGRGFHQQLTRTSGASGSTGFATFASEHRDVLQFADADEAEAVFGMVSLGKDVAGWQATGAAAGGEGSTPEAELSDRSMHQVLPLQSARPQQQQPPQHRIMQQTPAHRSPQLQQPVPPRQPQPQQPPQPSPQQMNRKRSRTGLVLPANDGAASDTDSSNSAPAAAGYHTQAYCAGPQGAGWPQQQGMGGPSAFMPPFPQPFLAAPPWAMPGAGAPMMPPFGAPPFMPPPGMLLPPGMMPFWGAPIVPGIPVDTPSPQPAAAAAQPMLQQQQQQQNVKPSQAGATSSSSPGSRPPALGGSQPAMPPQQHQQPQLLQHQQPAPPPAAPVGPCDSGGIKGGIAAATPAPAGGSLVPQASADAGDAAGAATVAAAAAAAVVSLPLGAAAGTVPAAATAEDVHAVIQELDVASLRSWVVGAFCEDVYLMLLDCWRADSPRVKDAIWAWRLHVRNPRPVGGAPDYKAFLVSLFGLERLHAVVRAAEAGAEEAGSPMLGPAPAGPAGDADTEGATAACNGPPPSADVMAGGPVLAPLSLKLPAPMAPWAAAAAAPAGADDA